jgi:2-polyprenyl-6-methoxyphenol hydroxylase-like FAD-dependent oxidoreductase
MRQNIEIVIIGAGIAGLCTALFLEQHGIHAEIYESADTLGEEGAGLNIQPVAVALLARIGLLEQLERVSVAPRELRLMNVHGQEIWTESRGRHAGSEFPQLSIHRAHLHQVLLEAVKERRAAKLHFGQRMERMQPAGNGWRCDFQSASGARSSVEAAIAIGADGMGSAVRRHFYPEEGPPRWSRVLMWRGVTTIPPFLTGETWVIVGHTDHKFVVYPLQHRTHLEGGALVNWVAELRVDAELPPKESWNRKASAADFVAAYESWRFPWLDVPEVIRSTPEILVFPMMDRDPLPRWTFGSATLIGDAAHPTYPIGANGATQAIIDARTLADELALPGNIEAALSRYDAQRRPLTTAIVQHNRRGGPEELLRFFHGRAPQGFSSVDEIMSREEIAAMVKRTRSFS